MRVLRRYAPVLLLVAVQLALVVALPSRPPSDGAGDVELGGRFDPGSATTGGVTSGDAGGGGAPAPGVDGTGTAGTGGGGSTPGAGTAGGGGASTGATAGTGAGGTTGAAGGDRRHCTPDGRQFAESYYAPPCVARFAGDNGGATTPGVTGEEIRVIHYRSRPNPAVDGVLAQQGLGSTPEDDQRFDTAVVKTMNGLFEMYGRTLRYEYVLGTCQAEPPDVPCFRNEARRIIATKRPFAVWWRNSIVPEFYDELARGGVVSFGGWHFDDGFNAAHRPYHYDIQMGGIQSARMAAEYWCKKLVGRRARYAGSPDMSGRARVAGIIVPNQQTSLVSANELRRRITGGQCGAGESAFVYTYELNPATAGEQARALIQKMRTDRITSILLFSEPVGPAFFTKAATAQGFFPEYVLVGVNFTDYDLVGRLYDQAQWANAFGISHISARVAKERQEATIAYRRGGGTGNPHGQAELDFFYLGLIATGVQLAGPNLTPLTFERALLTSPARGGWTETRGRADLFLVQFGPDDYTALSDAREVYWSNTAVSTVDGRPGSYVPFANGRRYRLGEWPAGEPALPGR